MWLDSFVDLGNKYILQEHIHIHTLLANFYPGCNSIYVLNLTQF